MRTWKIGLMLAAATLAFSVTSSAKDDPIVFTISTTLSLSSGTDAGGLSGATVSINVLFDSNAQYVSGIAGQPKLLSESASVTVSGSSVVANNQTYALPTLDFYAKQGVLDVDPTNLFPNVFLGDGGQLLLKPDDTASTHGSSVQVGDTVNVLDFAPADSRNVGYVLLEDGNQSYDQNNTLITASVVPEPSSLVLCGIAGLTGLLVARRRRRTRKRGQEPFPGGRSSWLLQSRCPPGKGS